MENQKEMPLKAREMRLKLQKIRVDADKERKVLKEDSLRRGRAIDGMFNIIKDIIEPLEKHLQEQEDFVKLKEQERGAEIAEHRRAELLSYGADPQFYKLEDMTDEVYEQLLEGAMTAQKSKKEAEEKAKKEEEAKEAEAEEAAKKKAVEDDRIRKENEELKAKEEVERKKKEKAEAELKEKEEAEAKEKQDEEDAKNEALKAPDKEKLLAFATAIATLEPPKLESLQAQAVLAATIGLLVKTYDYIESKTAKL